MWVECSWSRHWSRECTERKGIAILGSLITQGPKRSADLGYTQKYKATGLLKALNVVHCGRESWFYFSALPPLPLLVFRHYSFHYEKSLLPSLCYLANPLCPVYIKIFEVLFMHPLGMTFWLGLSCVGICRVWSKAVLLTYLSHLLLIPVQGISEGNLNRGMLWPHVSFRRVFVPHYCPCESTKDFY